MSEDIPEEWFLEEHKPLVIGWLVIIPVPPKTKKWALWEWCQRYGFEMTREDVEAVTGLPAGEI